MARKIAIVVLLFVLSSAIFQALINLEKNNVKVAKPQYKTPTLKSIFSDHSWTNPIPAEDKIVLMATGDVIPARVVNIQAAKYNNYKWPYENIASVLNGADMTFINLESPLLKDCPLVNDGFKFCGDARHIDGLVMTGVDVASFANNHLGNYGIEGITETSELLQKNGILVTGQKGPVYKTAKGVKFAFLGYNDIGYDQEGISWADEENIKKEVKLAKKNADVVVVAFHWGVEYVDYPDERQRFLGHLAVDSGADLVIGNHPHWIQPVEFYKGKLITYAHGNFVFDQEWSLETKQGLVGKYTFVENKLIDVEFFPILIEDYGKPRFMSEDEGKVILSSLKKQSELLQSEKH